MSILSAVLKTAALGLSLTGAFYAGKFHGRSCEDKDHRLRMYRMNNRAESELAQLVADLGEIKEELKEEFSSRLDAIRRKIRNNATVDYIWGDVRKDVADLVAFVKGEVKDAAE